MDELATSLILSHIHWFSAKMDPDNQVVITTSIRQAGFFPLKVITMQTIPNWANLWKELVELNDTWGESWQSGEDRWKNRSGVFSENIEKRWSRPDSSREFLVSRLRAHPEATLVDIGAGTGAWAILAARYAAAVTAIDQSEAMLEVMRQNLDKVGATNVRIIQGSWPEVDVEPHDFSLCSHAMYGAPDLPGFIRKMMAVTRRTCFLLIRAPKLDGLMGEFARMVLGHPYDSPNFVVLYNTLIEMGIYANVLTEDTGLWKPWMNDSLEEALADVKRRLGLKNNPAYDAAIYGRLEEKLTYVDGKYIWPPGVRSVLVYWDIT
jgi:SAM-dependent methyltransferase